MREALLIEHVAHEGPGTIARALGRRGVSIKKIRLHKGERLPRKDRLRDYSCVIVMGGPMGVYEPDVYPFINDEVRLLKSALQMGTPILGICLGAQILAYAAGASVYKSGVKEIGWYKLDFNASGQKDPLFAGLGEEETVFQWHGDTFDIPSGAKNLASSKLIENQLIKAGGNSYGLQFHLEVTGEMVEDWVRVNASELDSLKGTIDPVKILADTPIYIEKLNRMGEAVFNRFLRNVSK